MIADAQDQQQRDQENDQPHNFAEEFRDDGLATLFEVKIPKIAIDQSDHHGGAQKRENGADVVAQVEIEPINPGSKVKSEGKGEELEKNAEPNAGATFQEPPDREGDEKCRNKNRNRGEVALGIGEGEHRSGMQGNAQE